MPGVRIGDGAVVATPPLTFRAEAPDFAAIRGRLSLPPTARRSNCALATSRPRKWRGCCPTPDPEHPAPMMHRVRPLLVQIGAGGWTEESSAGPGVGLRRLY